MGSMQHFDNIRRCTACELHEEATQVVVGEGPLSAYIMFVGEAPGEREDEIGLPFVGKSGELLRDKLREFNVRPNDVYITNVIKCRPPNNRDPTVAEVWACRSHLKYQLMVIRPKIVVPVGRFALGYFIPGNPAITAVNGQVFERGGRYIIPMIHPAYALRKRAAKEALDDAMAVITNTRKELLENVVPGLDFSAREE